MFLRLFIAALWSPAILAPVGDVYCIFVTSPLGILGQVWYLIVSFSDLCLLSYFAQGHNAVTPVRLEPAVPRFRVKYSTTKPLRSHYAIMITLSFSEGSPLPIRSSV